MIQLEYTKKPSITTLRAALLRARKAGEHYIQFTWGENQITIEQTRSGWHGFGWIGRTGGHDLVQKMMIDHPTLML